VEAPKTIEVSPLENPEIRTDSFPLETKPFEDPASTQIESVVSAVPESNPPPEADPVALAALQKLEEKRSRFNFYSRQKDPRKAMEQQFKKAQKEEKVRADNALKEQKKQQKLEIQHGGTPRKPEKIKQKKGFGQKKVLAK